MFDLHFRGRESAPNDVIRVTDNPDERRRVAEQERGVPWDMIYRNWNVTLKTSNNELQNSTT